MGFGPGHGPKGPTVSSPGTGVPRTSGVLSVCTVSDDILVTDPNLDLTVHVNKSYT